MLTGIEPAILSAAANAATRAAGWGAHEARSTRRSRKLRKFVKEIEDVHEQDESITPDIVANIGEYLQSPQFDHLSCSLASILIAQKSGRKSSEPILAIKLELATALEATAGVAASDAFTEKIFGALAFAVAAETARLTAQVQSPRVQAEAVKIAASIATASARNVQLLRSSTQIAEFLSFESQLREQIRSLHSTMRIPHAGTSRQVPYDQLFIAPRLGFADATNSIFRGIQLGDLLERSTRAIILGDPGGGKSTLALKLAYDIASGNVSDVSARVPLLVVLRDYAQDNRKSMRPSILEYLDHLCRTPYAVTPPENALEYLLLNGRAFVIFDGLDELLDTSLRRDVVQAVEGFAYRYPTTPVLVTSRRIGYEEAPLDSDLFPALQLMDLDNQQVQSYAHKWFALDESQPPTERDRLARAFLRDSVLVDDLRVNPLMLSLMCGIYSTENYIPRNRPDVYEKCALLLFDRWDKQRGIQVALSFDAHIHAALRSLALYMYRQEQPQLRRQDLVSYIKNYLLEKRFDDADIAEAAAEEFIDFCKGRAWVLTDVGEEKYGFTHRTFLEYFSASQLVRLNHGAEELFTELQARLAAREWDVVAQLALQILGRWVEDGADEFIGLTINAARTAEFSSKANFISFASRALQFIVPRPEILRSIVTSSVELLDDPAVDRKIYERRIAHLRPSAQAAVNLLGVSPELRAEVGKMCTETIAKRMTQKGQHENLIAFSTVPWIFTDVALEESPRATWSFWEPWAESNWTHLAEYINPAAKRYYWLDVVRLRKDEITIEELLARHGAKALYEFEVAGYGTYPPIAYDLLSQSTPRLLGRNRNSGGKKLQDIVATLDLLLPDVPTPWLRYSPRYDVLAEAAYWAPGAIKVLSPQLVLLLSAPLVELDELSRRKTTPPLRASRGKSRVGNQVFDILNMRGRQDISPDEVSVALGEVDISSGATDLLRRWILHDLDFVVSRGRRRRLPT